MPDAVVYDEVGGRRKGSLLMAETRDLANPRNKVNDDDGHGH